MNWVCEHVADWLADLEHDGLLDRPAPPAGTRVGDGWDAIVATTTREVWKVPPPLVLDTGHDIHHWFMSVRCAVDPGPWVLVHLCGGPGGCRHPRRRWFRRRRAR